MALENAELQVRLTTRFQLLGAGSALSCTRSWHDAALCRASLQVGLAYAAASLYFCHLLSQGRDPNSALQSGLSFSCDFQNLLQELTQAIIQYGRTWMLNQIELQNAASRLCVRS